MSSMEFDNGRLTFICGGVRSGKSAYGEKTASSLKHHNGRLIYIATARQTDPEMRDRIKKHQADRANKKEEWVTLEKTKDLKSCCEEISKFDTVFIDCLTTWLSNEMFGENSELFGLETIKKRIIEAESHLERTCSHLIMISNDIFYEQLPRDITTRRYVKMLGELHQYFVERAECAIKMESGIPVVMKGGAGCEGVNRMGDDL